MAMSWRIALQPAAKKVLPAAVIGAFACGPVQATETINLTAIDGYPTKSMWVKEFIDFYIPEIDKRLAETGNYKIRWNQAFGGQIVKPRFVFQGIQKGLGDIGVVTTVFHHDKVPLQAIAYVTPFVTTDPALVSKTVDDLADKFPEYRATWDKYDQVYLTNMAVFDSYQMFAKTPISSTNDFEGMKVGGAGTNLRYLQGMGTAGVSGGLPSYYNKLQTGVISAVMVWPEAAITFKMYELAPYMLKADLGTANSKAVTVNKNTWNRLPGEVQKVIQEAALDYRDHTAKVALEIADESLAKFRDAGGKVTELSAEDRNKWAQTMPNIAKEWAEEREKEGLPGKAILSAYMEAMRAANQSIPRQWDKE